MKLLGTILVGILVLTLCSATSVRSLHSLWTRDPGLDDQWQEYLTKFDKVYSTPEEIAYRRSVWEENLKKFERHNTEADQGLHTWWMGVNQFTDMAEEDLARIYSGRRPDRKRQNVSDVITFLPNTPSLDWRTKGMVTRVKDQTSNCGSCYAFAVVGAVESAYAIENHGKLVEFSEQELVDCSKNYPENDGCSGGRTDSSLKYLIDLKAGINLESCYKYIAKENPTCKRSIAPHCLGAVVKALGQADNEHELLAAVNNTPVAISVCSTTGLLHYKTGVFHDTCPTNPKYHSMLVVGYGEEKGKPFWIVKNSHGVSYGEGGYIRIERNKNTLKIGDFGDYPIL